LFWRGSGSGCTLFPSPHGTVAFVGDGTPVALPPMFERMEQRMPERRRFNAANCP
jgi:hypothetical protein